MRESMSPSRGSGIDRGLTFEQACADKSDMRSPWASSLCARARSRWSETSLARRQTPWAAPAAAGRERERGQALVEFALIAPLFLMIVVGIIQFGIGLNYWLDLNRIANQGARWAV